MVEGGEDFICQFPDGYAVVRADVISMSWLAVEQDCPESDEYACPWGIACAKALRPPELPDAVFASSNSPKAGLNAHRKMPASVEYHVDGDRWQAAGLACLSDTNFDHAGAGSPTYRTGRKQPLGHLV